MIVEHRATCWYLCRAPECIRSSRVEMESFFKSKRYIPWAGLPHPQRTFNCRRLPSITLFLYFSFFVLYLGYRSTWSLLPLQSALRCSSQLPRPNATWSWSKSPPMPQSLKRRICFNTCSMCRFCWWSPVMLLILADLRAASFTTILTPIPRTRTFPSTSSTTPLLWMLL